ncbi:aminotransferase [Terribacillus saccharophilus]|uniref:Aminotransferase n=1 Tax=Terribacillus saccharophilus TaxID=361277 RepID=A0A268A8D2_9BACI|nr:aminotransferase [Terribacillus saccharophilus]PAD20386.1 aromatic amino acid aminotransferase [Terribacillus saccharophilus]PAF18400.1 aromatic amino acid aminotransferase [Terribacillus saccharophilus]PAF20673.1 aromatic amino acid aminotransferase [Terribacillus saccharophilus]PAF35934.1 aromatic amino acid aminotransferase [Terribacillus saccharophilus]PAF40087.1 aromatic amino acid aminotransferase [Terribacillus saccharophilus]
MSLDTSRFIAEHVDALKPSGIRRFFDLASTMDNVISLGVGEPDFVTPWNVIEASYHSLEQGYTAYTANAGLMELRELISDYLKTTYSVTYRPADQVIVTVGASQAIDIALRAVLNPGDEVIIVEPCFVAYASAVSLAGGVPVSVGTKAGNGFKLQPEELENALTSKTKAIILCNPNNPTGTMLNREELLPIAELVEKHDLLVLSDEIYAELSYEADYVSFSSLPNMQDRTILISGFSKSFAMTGWRLGYAAGPAELIQAMTKIHQYTIMCAPTMAQYGAVEALRSGSASVEHMRKSYRQRRNFVTSAFEEMGLETNRPGGAFYIFPSIKETGMSSEAFAEALLIEEKVAVVPGSVFGESGEGYIRCSYATSMKQLTEAMKRIKRFVEKHNA